MLEPRQSQKSLLRRRANRVWVGFALVAVTLLAASLYGVGLYGRAKALEALQEQGRNEAGLKVALLQAVLERPRAMPRILARDRDLEDALRRPEQAEELSRKLEELVADTGATVIYVIGMNGIAISASNWREPTSFVGNDYSFRAYFSRALEEGSAEHFALGSVSKHPGLYISQRVGPASAPLGVVVVKMEFDQLERDWDESRGPAYVVDENHVVLITSLPSWRFMTTVPLAPQSLAAIRESLQFGEAPLVALPMEFKDTLAADAAILRVVLPGGGAADYLRIVAPVPSTRWQFEYLMPIREPVSAVVREMRLMAALGLGVAFTLAALWLWRREAVLARIAGEQLAREELERRVAERTRDLSLVRDRLEAEMADHQTTEEQLQVVQQDLVQANRLAILGQVAVGVAHEINQPVATIRAYADNSRIYLERQQTEPALENLDRIAGLTERIGVITEDLKALARRGRAEAEAVSLQDVLDGAVMLLRSRFTGRLDRLSIASVPAGLQVSGNRLRLEQVFINLFQNALEAIDGRADGHVDVGIDVESETVTVRVADNGPGIAPDILAVLFKPFNSSKEKGLGLGLVISKDIVADYGGHISVDSGAGGTSFLVRLGKVGA